MQPRVGQSPGRLTNIVRAAALEVAPPAAPAPSVPASKPIRVAPVIDLTQQNAQAVRDLLGTLRQQVDALQQRRRQTIDELSRLSVDMAVALAERLLCTEIAGSRQRLDRIVQQALERLPAARSVTVRGNADDLALLEQQWKEHAESGRESMTLRPDATIARGQLKLEADELFVEWDTISCLTELRSALLEETNVAAPPGEGH